MSNEPQVHKAYSFNNTAFDLILTTLAEDQELLHEFISWSIDRRPIMDSDVEAMSPVLRGLIFSEMA